MKKRAGNILVCALLLSCYTAVVSAENWIVYTHGPGLAGSPGKAKYFYDADSLKQVDTGVYAVMHKANLAATGDGYIIAQYWVNCVQGNMAIGESVTYILGKEFDRMNLYDNGWFRLRPNDPQQKLISIICH